VPIVPSGQQKCIPYLDYFLMTKSLPHFVSKFGKYTADCGEYNLFAYALEILVHIFSYQMEYHLVNYERPTYFQLSIAYMDINYCFAIFKYAEEYVSIPY